MSVDDDKILTPQALYAHTYDIVELFQHPGTTLAAFGDICVLSFFVFSEDVSLLIIAIESSKGHLCCIWHAALPSKQRSIQPFVGRWAEPSEFPSPANCPWISFGISKRHQWTSKAFLYRRDTKMRLCRDESILIITPPEPHFPSVYTLTCQVLLSRKQSLPEVGVCAKSARRCCLMWAAGDDDDGFSFITNERNWPLTSYYYVIT